jgi:hypothetical protein
MTLSPWLVSMRMKSRNDCGKPPTDWPRVATKAMPRNTAMVPRVTMKGCTRRATISPPFVSPHASAVPRQTAAPARLPAESDVAGQDPGAEVIQDERAGDGGEGVDRADGKIDAAGDDHEGHPDRHDGDEARVLCQLSEVLGVEELVPLRQRPACARRSHR